MQRIHEIYSELYKNYSYNYSYMDRVIQCKDTQYIPKTANAGEIIDKNGTECQVMHNGVLIHEGCYHQSYITDIIKALKGHHEPQEEKLFYEVLKYMPSNALMIECGSFWSYYSLWFHKEIQGGRNIMIEPTPLKKEIGELNFDLNEFEGQFINAYIGDSYEEKSTFRDWDSKVYAMPKISIDWLLESNSIDRVNILHVDIQNNEMMLLDGAKKSLSQQKIDFIFLGTHSSNYPIAEKLKSYSYHIIEEFEVNQSFFDDGLILACSNNVINDIDPTNLKVSKLLK